MDYRTALTALGVGATAFLLVGAAVTAALDATTPFSALVGLPAGALVGVGTFVFAYVALERGVTARFRRALFSTAAAGYAVVGLLVVWNLSAAVRSAVSIREVGALAAVAAVATYVALALQTR